MTVTIENELATNYKPFEYNPFDELYSPKIRPRSALEFDSKTNFARIYETPEILRKSTTNKTRERPRSSMDINPFGTKSVKTLIRRNCKR